MKLNPSFVRYSMDDKALVVPVAGASFRGVIRGNRSVEVILDLLENDMTEDQIVSEMCARFDGDPDEIRADVADVLSRLREVGAISE